jgi:hypothetical protein
MLTLWQRDHSSNSVAVIGRNKKRTVMLGFVCLQNARNCNGKLLGQALFQIVSLWGFTNKVSFR